MNWPFSTDSAHLLLSIGSCLVSTGPVLWSPFAAGSVGCLDMRRDEHEGAWFMELEESIDSVSFAIYHQPVESLLGMLHRQVQCRRELLMLSSLRLPTPRMWFATRNHRREMCHCNARAPNVSQANCSKDARVDSMHICLLVRS